MSERTPLTETELDAMQARCDAATPGPTREGIGGNTRLYGPDGTEHAGLLAVFFGLNARQNLTLLAHARTDVPALCASHEALRQENERLKRERDKVQTQLTELSGPGISGSDIKACPFCGAPALLEYDDSPGQFPYSVSCGGNACPITSVCAVGKSSVEVTAAWNKRYKFNAL